MAKETGGSAFPIPIAGNSNGFVDADERGVDTGMTLRDYFAAKAMQGFISNEYETKELSSAIQKSGDDCEFISRFSYEMADAMLKARDK